MTVKISNWGPIGWKFIHYVCLHYPEKPTEENKQNYKTFLTYIGKILPCKTCNDHYNEHLSKFPLTDEVLSNNDNLLKWSIDMHNLVNKLNGQKVYEYDEAIKLIKENFNCYPQPKITIENMKEEKKETKEKSRKNKYIYILLLVLLLIAFVIFFKPVKRFVH